VLLIFGTKKLRNIGSDLGGAVKGFKEGMKEETPKLNETAESGRTIDAEVKDKSHS
jgi:sec-independent protein translocase protein TatA